MATMTILIKTLLKTLIIATLHIFFKFSHKVSPMFVERRLVIPDVNKK